MIQKYVKILLILGMAACLCGGVNAAAVGIIAETHETSGVSAPVCTAPCECMSESAAIAQWGVNGYEMCSKTICGQSADAMVQYYCIHQVGGTVAAPAVTRTAATTTALTTVSQQTVQAPVQTQVSSAEVTANPSASSTWPAAGAVTKKSPLGIATSLAAISAALLAAAAMRRK
jgi:hypothetical protein